MRYVFRRIDKSVTRGIEKLYPEYKITYYKTPLMVYTDKNSQIVTLCHKIYSPEYHNKGFKYNM